MYKSYHAWFFLLPALVLLLVFNFIPAIWVILLSFMEYNVIQPMEWVGLANYIRLANDAEFWNALKNTLYYWFLVTPALVIIPIFVAVLVNQKLVGIKFFRLTIYFPFLVSVVVTAIMWGWMLRSDGVINYVLSLLNLEPVSWLTKKSTAMPSLAMITIWQGIGYYMLIYLGGLQAIPNELYESAELDGAGFLRKQWHITFPMLRPVIFFVAVVSTMAAFKEFTLMLVMTEGGPLGATQTVVYLIFEKAFRSLDMGYASTIATVLFVIILALTILNRRFLDRETS
ncbi:MAG: sugar ABC transporter permease [Hydrogenibacillus sp.]|nr:sugar ABC transporter permease [Hydrogenibacillus sp.]